VSGVCIHRSLGKEVECVRKKPAIGAQCRRSENRKAEGNEKKEKRERKKRKNYVKASFTFMLQSAHFLFSGFCNSSRMIF
jgi:hypothetical protein